jgi:hypothetical protein
MSIIINPGSGPVGGADPDLAHANIESFLADLRDAGHTAALIAPGPEEDGRWTFTIKVDGVAHEIEMPGIPLAKVRYLGTDDQDIWDFPRLYVDGSSWVWLYALNVAAAEEGS